MSQYELARLARICRGAFSPSNTEESMGADGTVRLTFRSRGRASTHDLHGDGTDWIDPALLWIVNAQLQDSPYRLHVPADPEPGQSVFLTVLDSAERAIIEDARELLFVPVPSEPTEDVWWVW